MSTDAPGKDTNRYFQEIEEGEKFTVEEVRTITEADVVSFAGVSGDFHPYHMSKEMMQNSQFEGRIAHGLLVFSVAEALIADMNPRSFTYGHDGVRFPEPTYMGDTLTVNREIVNVEDYDENYGRVDYKYVAETKDDRTVFVCKQHITLVERRE